MLAWATATEEFTPRGQGRCYERHTDFNRDDVRQMREAAWPSKVPDLDVEDRDGVQVLVGRERHMDFADTEFAQFLDEVGRVTKVRQRPAEFGVLPAGRWETWRYEYPSPAQFARLAGGAPRPRCA